MTMEFAPSCPDCETGIGEEHIDGCDVARCLVTGHGRLACDADHDCGHDTWTGWWPGIVECLQFGWKRADGDPDLDRLHSEATWDRGRLTWVPTGDQACGASNRMPLLSGFEPYCPDCGVGVGSQHIYDEYDGGCDVARCLVSGWQRLMCDADHDCGREVWTGFWPGHIDCERLGWMLGPGFHDLNRLLLDARWDPDRRAWVKAANQPK